MEHPGSRVPGRSWPAGTQDGMPVRDDLGFRKKITESRMQSIGDPGAEHYFRITGHIDDAFLPGAVRQVDPPHLDIILRRYDDLRMGQIGRASCRERV